MTLIIGILCTDGVVLGSDTQATYDSMGQPTIRQEDFSKLNVICDQRAILGVSGPVGLAQRIAAEIERMNKAKEIPGSAVDAMVAKLAARFGKGTSVRRCRRLQWPEMLWADLRNRVRFA